MTNTNYIILSRQSALSRELNSVANNVANANTQGYRREGALFSEYIRALGENSPSVSQTRLGGHFFDASPGDLVQTGAPFDLAINGRGYFLIETRNGERLTRAGAFSLNAEGEIVTVDGDRVLGESGSPIAVPPEAGQIVIANDGTISGDGVPIGKIGVVTAAPTTLAREGANLFFASEGYEPVDIVKVSQGFVEGSNVNAVTEISRLIELQRAYELGQQLLQDENDRVKRTIETFGNR